jgi:hypothetical protein
MYSGPLRDIIDGGKVQEWRKRPTCKYAVFCNSKFQDNERWKYKGDPSLLASHAYVVVRVGNLCMRADGMPGWEFDEVCLLHDADGNFGVPLPKYGRPISGAFLRPTALHKSLMVACNASRP